MWRWVLNVKCLLSRLFSAHTQAQWSPEKEPSAATSGPCPATTAPHPSQQHVAFQPYRWGRSKESGTGPGWITSIFIFLCRSSCSCSWLFLSFPKTFFWVSAAGDLLLSVGWVCRSPPALEILPGLQPRLHLLMHLLHAPAVRLAGLGRATTISGVFKSSSVCSIISTPPCVQQDTDPVSWTVMPSFLWFPWWGPNSMAALVTKVPTWGPRRVGKVRKNVGCVLGRWCLPKIYHKLLFSCAGFQNSRSVTLINARWERWALCVSMYVSKVNSGIAFSNPRKKRCGFAAHVLQLHLSLRYILEEIWLLPPSQLSSRCLIQLTLIYIWGTTLHKSSQTALQALACKCHLLQTEIRNQNQQIAHRGKQQFWLIFRQKMSVGLHIPAGPTEIWCPKSQPKQTHKMMADTRSATPEEYLHMGWFYEIGWASLC